jgi:hypothetical protein
MGDIFVMKAGQGRIVCRAIVSRTWRTLRYLQIGCSEYITGHCLEYNACGPIALAGRSDHSIHSVIYI